MTEMCQARTGGGRYQCYRPMGHDGAHVARPNVTWPNESEGPRPGAALAPPTVLPSSTLWTGLWREFLRRVGVVNDESARVLAHPDAAGIFAQVAAEYLFTSGTKETPRHPLERLDDAEVMRLAQHIAGLARDTAGWTSHIAWYVRRAIQAAEREGAAHDGR